MSTKRKVRIYAPVNVLGDDFPVFNGGGGYFPKIDSDRQHFELGGLIKVPVSSKMKKGGSSIALQNTDITQFGTERLSYLKDYLAGEATRKIAQDEYMAIAMPDIGISPEFQTGGNTAAWAAYGYDDSNSPVGMYADKLIEQENQLKTSLQGLGMGMNAMKGKKYWDPRTKINAKYLDYYNQHGFNPGEAPSYYSGPDYNPNMRQEGGDALPIFQTAGPVYKGIPINKFKLSQGINTTRLIGKYNPNGGKKRFVYVEDVPVIRHDMKGNAYQAGVTKKPIIFEEGSKDFTELSKLIYTEGRSRGIKSNSSFVEQMNSYNTNTQVKQQPVTPTITTPVATPNIQTKQQPVTPAAASPTNIVQTKPSASGITKDDIASGIQERINNAKKPVDANVRANPANTQPGTQGNNSVYNNQPSYYNNNPYLSKREFQSRRAILPGNRLKSIVETYSLPGQYNPNVINVDAYQNNPNVPSDNTIQDYTTDEVPRYLVGPEDGLAYNDNNNRSNYFQPGGEELPIERVQPIEYDPLKQYFDPEDTAELPSSLDHRTSTVADYNKATGQQPEDWYAQTKWKQKTKRRFGPMLGAAMDFAAYVGNQRTNGNLERKIEGLTAAENLFTPMSGNRGHNTFNPVGFDMVKDAYAPQFTGMAKCGGQMKKCGGQYQEGGSYELTTDQINEILQAGGQIEYL